MTLTSGRIPTVPATQTQKRDPEVIMNDIAKVQSEITSHMMTVAKAGGNRGCASYMSKVDKLGGDGINPALQKAHSKLAEFKDEYDIAVASSRSN